MKGLIIVALMVLLMFTMDAQKKETFLYNLELIEKFKIRSNWTEKEHMIQKAHVKYLDSLTKSGRLFLAGIKEQGLQYHRGLVILNVSSYEEAYSILQNDPSIKMCMMTGDIEKLNIYFLKKD